MPSRNIRRAGRRAGPRGAGWLILVMILAVGLGVLIWRALPRQASPAAWNRLAKLLLADEFDGDTHWNPVLMANASTPKAPPAITAQFRSSVLDLDSHWLGRNWNGLPPGQLPPLRAAARAYGEVYRFAHASPRITVAFDGRGLPVAESIANPAEPGWLLGQLGRLKEDLSAAAAPWARLRSPPGAAPDTDRLRALLVAHDRLLTSEAALLQLMADHPNGSTITVAADGSTQVTSPDAGFLHQAQTLLSSRAQAVSDLRLAEADAQKN